jgi:hypothetical protein
MSITSRRELFARIRQHPGMYFCGGQRYETVVAFLTGIDMTDGMLTGFEEWLLPRFGGGANIIWWGTVMHIALGGDGDKPLLAEMSEEQHQRAIGTLWTLLDDFLAAKNGHLAMRGIYTTFCRWQDQFGGHEPRRPPPPRSPMAEADPPVRMSRDEMTLGSGPEGFAQSLRSGAAHFSPEDFDRLLDSAELNARSDEHGHAIAEAIILMVESRNLVPMDAEGVLYRLSCGPKTDAGRAEALPLLREARLRSLAIRAMSRHLVSAERAILLSILQEQRFPHASVLAAQVPRTVVIGGAPTFVDLMVEGSAPPADCPDGPVPGRAIVEGHDDEPVGEILLWVKNGYLDGLEYAWYTDEAPVAFPPVERLKLE